MALRNILTQEQPGLYKKCRPVTDFNQRLHQLLDDMAETLSQANGVGLAAPQVGILKRIAVVDITEDKSCPVVLINPEILSTEGEQRGSEGCLSVPDKVGIVTRPNKVKVKALDIDMNPVEIEGEELFARALIHEIEHLDGQLYVDKIEGRLYDVDEFQEED